MSNMHYLLKQFNNFYQEKLDEVDKEAESKNLSQEATLKMKLDILKGYVSDLGEQNLNLIETATELQAAAENRVSVLEKLLQKTTVGCKEYVKQLMVYQKEMEKVSQEKAKLTAKLQNVVEQQDTFEEERKQLSAENLILRSNLISLYHFLNNFRSVGFKENTLIESEKSMHNINCLLEPVEKYLSNSGSVDGINDVSKDHSFLFEGSPNYPSANSHSVGSPSISVSCHSHEDCSVFSGSVTEKDVIIKRLQIDLDCVVKNRNEMQFKILDLHRTIATLQSQITELQHELSLKESECVQLAQGLKTQEDQNMLTNVERSYFEELVRQLRKQIADLHDGVTQKSNKLHSSGDDENGSELVCNAATQTDINHAKLCMWQKELNRLQSTVIGLKIALAQRCFPQECTCTECLKRTEEKSVKSDESAELFRHLCHHHLTEKSVNLQLLDKSLELFSNMHPCQESKFPSHEWKWAEYIYKDQGKPFLAEEATTSPVTNEDSSISDSGIGDQSHVDNSLPADMLISLEELKEKLLQLEINNKELESERDKFQEEAQKLKEELRVVEAAAQETRIVLTREIAERFDTIKSLRQEIVEQAEQHKETVQQLVLKTEVLKGLRREMKRLQTKVSEDEILLEKIPIEKKQYDEKIDHYIKEIENQKITINNLQDALVQARRNSNSFAAGNAVVLNGSSGHSAKGRSPSSRDIFDI